MEISIIIPAYNEEKTIKETIKKVVKQKNILEIVVVDDGSTDKTGLILEKIRKNTPKLKNITHIKNQGKGAAICTALAKAKGEFVLIQDADLEYNPSEYVKLFEAAGPQRVVYGSRLLEKNPRAYNRTYLGNIFLTLFCNILFGTKLTDSYTCYKLIPTKIARSLDLHANGFEMEAEITAKIAKRNIPIVEVPISYRPRTYKEGKKIKAIDAIKGLLLFTKIKFNL